MKDHINKIDPDLTLHFESGGRAEFYPLGADNTLILREAPEGNSIRGAKVIHGPCIVTVEYRPSGTSETVRWSLRYEDHAEEHKEETLWHWMARLITHPEVEANAEVKGEAVEFTR